MTERPDPTRHMEEFLAYEREDIANGITPGGIVFTGSSSVRIWDVKTAFPGLPVLNRGFGGSIYNDLIQNFHRVIKPYTPRTLVLYSGDNDAACGLTPQEVLDDWKTVVAMTLEAFPKIRILCMAAKPCIARWALDERFRQFNSMMESCVRSDDRLIYVDSYHPMLDVNNRPPVEYFMEDGLHMTPAGYAVWNNLLRPYLEK